MSAGFCNVFTGHNRSIHYLTDNVYGSGIVEGHFAGYTTIGLPTTREPSAENDSLKLSH